MQETLALCARCQFPRLAAAERCLLCAVGEGSPIGPYRVLRPLGEGATGQVFACASGDGERLRAVKLLTWDSPSARPFLVDRLRRDSRIVAQIRHPHVLSLDGIGNWNGCAYVAMELLAGGSVEDLLKREGVLSPTRALAITRDAALGLAVAAEAGLVHRDIKPSNLLLDAEGRVRVTDFGIAGSAMEVNAAVSRAAPLLGTPTYMSPEQAQGRWVDYRCDMYALGVTLYRLLTGHLPFEGASALAILVKQVAEPLPDLSTLDAHTRSAIEPLLARLTAKLADDRYATWQEAILDLDAATAALAAEGTAQTSGRMETLGAVG